MLLHCVRGSESLVDAKSCLKEPFHQAFGSLATRPARADRVVIPSHERGRDFAMRLHRSLAIVPILILAGAIPRGASASDPVLEQRVRTEYPQALARLELRYAVMQGRAILNAWVGASNQRKDDPTKTFDFAFDERHGKTTRTTKTGASEGKKSLYQTASGFNPKYSFTIQKEEPSSDWFLRAVSDGPTSGVRNCSTMIGRAVLCTTQVNEINLQGWMKSSSTKFDSVTEEATEADPHALLIRFTTTPINRETKQAKGTKQFGWLVVSPDEGWILREYGISHSRGEKVNTTHVGQVEYRRSTDGHLDPSRRSERVFIGLAERGTTQEPAGGSELTIESLRFDALPESDFLLSAFGLPEPSKGDTPPPAARWPWFLGAAMLAFGVAAGLKYASGRSRRVAES